MSAAPVQPVRSVIRTILAANPDLNVEDVSRRLKARGMTVSDAAVKKAFYNVRGEVRKPTAAKAAPAAARSSAAPAETPAAGVELGTVLSNVALVNKVVGACGGIDPVRQVAEAVRSCGSVDIFLQHLDIVAGIRSTATSE